MRVTPTWLEWVDSAAAEMELSRSEFIETAVHIFMLDRIEVHPTGETANGVPMAHILLNLHPLPPLTPEEIKEQIERPLGLRAFVSEE